MRSRELVGVGVAACAACCAVPIAALLVAGGGLAGLGVVAFGLLGAVAVMSVLAGYLVRRRRRPDACEVPAGPIAVPLSPRPGRADSAANRRRIAPKRSREVSTRRVTSRLDERAPG